MKLLFNNIVGQKNMMLRALTMWASDSDTERVVALVRAEAEQIRTLNANLFANQIHKLLLAGMPDRAGKLVNALGDREPSRLGSFIVWMLAITIRVVPVVLIVLLTVWVMR